MWRDFDDSVSVAILNDHTAELIAISQLKCQTTTITRCKWMASIEFPLSYRSDNLRLNSGRLSSSPLLLLTVVETRTSRMRVRTTDPCNPCRTLSLFSCHPAITFVYENRRRIINFVVVDLTNGLDDAHRTQKAWNERINIENPINAVCEKRIW